MPDSGKFKDLYLNSAHTYACQGGERRHPQSGHCSVHLLFDSMVPGTAAKRRGRASEVVRPVAKRNETAQLRAIVSGPLAGRSNANRISPLVLGLTGASRYHTHVLLLCVLSLFVHVFLCIFGQFARIKAMRAGTAKTKHCRRVGSRDASPPASRSPE